MNDSEAVKEFTQESGYNVPERPEKMNFDEVSFIVKMVIDEMMELYATVAESKDYKVFMIDMINNAKSVDIPYKTMTDKELIAEQGDALVDAYYYSLNSACKKGINLSKIFQLVHGANMAKRDPKTGKFLRREDGKIIKPEGWKEPNILEEIERQTVDGSWEK